MSQLLGTALGVVLAVLSGFLICGVLKKLVGIRLDAEQEFEGADFSVHRIGATPERETNW